MSTTPTTPLRMLSKHHSKIQELDLRLVNYFGFKNVLNYITLFLISGFPMVTIEEISFLTTYIKIY